MTPRERLLTALNHKEPDRIPYDLGSTSITGISLFAYRRLLDHLDIEIDDIPVFDFAPQLAQVDEQVLQQFKVDTRGLRARGNHGPDSTSDWRLEVHEEKGRKVFTDEWGIKWKLASNNLYYDMEHHPLSGELTQEDIDNRIWPNFRDPVRIEGYREIFEQMQEAGYATILQLGAGLFERSLWIRNYTDFYIDMAGNPKLAGYLLDKHTDLRMDFWDMALGELGDVVDVVIEQDDLGWQDRPMISPQMYRDMIKPRHKRLFSFIKERAPNAYLFLHTDGAIFDMIPDLIEIGVDILNPVQVDAVGMDSSRVKPAFGDDLVFWGAGVESMTTLPKGTPQQVRDDVKRRIDDMAPGGGFVFTTIHNIQADVPPENIMAMWETLQEYGKY